MAQSIARPAIASPHFFSALIDRVDRVLDRNSAHPPSSSHVEPTPNPDPVVESSRPQFDAAFLDRRMREHREWQEQLAAEAASEIIVEVASAIEQVNQLRAGRGPAKIARLK
jgi:hypothetical protein